MGLLLGRLPEGGAPVAAPLRSVLTRGDAWLQTGDLFHRDADGDHWRDGAVAEVIRTADGPVVPVPVEDAVAALEAVDLAVAYGLPQPDGTEAVAVAVTLRAASRLDARALAAATAALPQRPAVVRVLDALPMTTWYRPRVEPLRAEGTPKAGAPAWWWDPVAEAYRRTRPAGPVTPAAPGRPRRPRPAAPGR